MSTPENLNSFSTPQLFDIAYKEDDEKKYWKLIGELHRRGSKSEFEQAQQFCEDGDPIKREIGADVLGQLGWEKQTFQEESIKILIELLDDKVEDVIASAAYSLGHRDAVQAIEPLVKFICHKNQRIRHAVTCALAGHEQETAISALIQLSKDEDYEVRNWATFNLGSQIEANNPQIIEALLARLDESESEIRGEALVGLANRNYSNILPLLKKELNRDALGILALEASELVGSKELHSLLCEWKRALGDISDDPYFEEKLNNAITACENK